MDETAMVTGGAGTIPRAIPLAAGLMLVVVLGAVASLRIAGQGPVVSFPDAPASVVRELRFVDRPDGSIDVFNSQNQHLVGVVAHGTGGFIRGTLRGLARARRAAGVSPALPLRLTAHTDGRLTLQDPSTGRRIDLESFGITNATAFAEMLTDKDQSIRLGSTLP